MSQKAEEYLSSLAKSAYILASSACVDAAKSPEAAEAALRIPVTTCVDALVPPTSHQLLGLETPAIGNESYSHSPLLGFASAERSGRAREPWAILAMPAW